MVGTVAVPPLDNGFNCPPDMTDSEVVPLVTFAVTSPWIALIPILDGNMMLLSVAWKLAVVTPEFVEVRPVTVKLNWYAPELVTDSVTFNPLHAKPP